MKKIVALIACAAMLLSGCGANKPAAAAEPAAEPEAEPIAEPAAEPAEDVWETLEEAYIYAFPLVLMDATMTSATNTETVVTGKAPVNQFMHGAGTVNASFKTVVTPNVDTVYTQVWLDLGEEPLIFTMPAADRFFNVQLLDGWTNTVAVLTEPGEYAFTCTDWDGELPEGVTLTADIAVPEGAQLYLVGPGTLASNGTRRIIEIGRYCPAPSPAVSWMSILMRSSPFLLPLVN